MERTGLVRQSRLRLQQTSQGSGPQILLTARAITHVAAICRQPAPGGTPSTSRRTSFPAFPRKATLPPACFLGSVTVGRNRPITLNDADSHPSRPRASKAERRVPLAAPSSQASKAAESVDTVGQLHTTSSAFQPPRRQEHQRHIREGGAAVKGKATQRREATLAKLMADEESFDRENYAPDDQAFWTEFHKLWYDPAEGPAVGVPVPPLEQTASNTIKRSKSKRRKARSLDPESFARLQRKNHLELQELVYLTSTSEPERRTEVTTLFKSWKRKFAKKFDRLLAQKQPTTKHTLPGQDQLTRLVDLEGVDQMRAAWQSKSPHERKQLWPGIALAMLHLRPHEAHLVLRATFEENIIPFYAVRDVVAYLVRRSTFLDDVGKQRTTADLFDLVLFLLDNSSNRYLQFPQWVLYTLVKGLPPANVACLYDALVRYGHPIHPNTLGHFAGCLASDSKHKSTSLQILQCLLKSGAVRIDQPRGAALCTSILSMKKADLKQHMPVTPAELFEKLLDLGLNPNLFTYTAIIRNLCLNGELHTAWNVFDTMIENNITPDAHLYSILLNGAKLRQDLHSLNRVARAARADGVRDRIVWNDLLHGLFVPWLAEARKKRMRPPVILPAFLPMLKAYTRFFQLDPLQKFTLEDVNSYLEAGPVYGGQWDTEPQVLSLISNLPPLDSQDLIEPGSDTLGIMLLAYLTGFSNPYNVIAFYAQFRGLLQRSDPTAVRLIEECGTLVYDIIIKAVLEWEGLLQVALEIVGDMLKGAQLAPADPASSLAGDRTTETTLRHPAPSIYTWSILLKGFMYHGKIGEAERILHMMRDYGVEPTIVTWNTLLAGYTRTQQVGKTVTTFQRIESAKLEPDDFTFKAFSYLEDQEGALQRMETLVAQRKRWLEEGREALVGTDVSPDDGIISQLRALESEAERMDGGDR